MEGVNGATERWPRSRSLIRQAGALELSLCLLFNRGAYRPRVQRFFAVVSRLGDGLFWYALMGLLVVADGWAGLHAALHMAIIGGAGLLIYKGLKRAITRERPFVTHATIRLGAAPLDRCSFPSGHTLHAVGFSLVAVSYYPPLAWLLFPFALLVATSRLVLGLHYPSDVVMGAAIGAALALVSFPLLAPLGVAG